MRAYSNAVLLAGTFLLSATGLLAFGQGRGGHAGAFGGARPAPQAPAPRPAPNVSVPHIQAPAATQRPAPQPRPITPPPAIQRPPVTQPGGGFKPTPRPTIPPGNVAVTPRPQPGECSEPGRGNAARHRPLPGLAGLDNDRGGVGQIPPG